VVYVKLKSLNGKNYGAAILAGKFGNDDIKFRVDYRSLNTTVVRK
jgi:hypothetical protein